MRITVIGGGNIGTLIAAEMAQKGHDITIFSSKPDKWNKEIAVLDPDDSIKFYGELKNVTDDLYSALKEAELILITIPAYGFIDLAHRMESYEINYKLIGIIPGSGGTEYAFHNLIKKGCTLFGLQRVHSIARLKEYGKSVYMLGRKKELQIGSIPIKDANYLCKVIEDLFDIPCVTLSNYLSVTLTPSNPILHTARLYTMFKEYHYGVTYSKQILFYEEWTDESSGVLIDCDDELKKLCDEIPLNLDAVISLKEHYGSTTEKSMTKKIRSIDAFKGLTSPMIKARGGWIPDFNSRYFTSDFSYGLKIIKDIAELFEVQTPNINKVWNWYAEINPQDPIKVFKLKMNKNEFIKLYNI